MEILAKNGRFLGHQKTRIKICKKNLHLIEQEMEACFYQTPNLISPPSVAISVAENTICIL